MTRVDKKSESLRLTIPAAVAALLGLRAGDSVVWSVEPGTGRTTVSRGEPLDKKQLKR